MCTHRSPGTLCSGPHLAAVKVSAGLRCHPDSRMGKHQLPGPFGMLAEFNWGPWALVAVSWGPPLRPGGCGLPYASCTWQVISASLWLQSLVRDTEKTFLHHIFKNTSFPMGHNKADSEPSTFHYVTVIPINLLFGYRTGSETTTLRGEVTVMEWLNGWSVLIF